MRNTTHYLALVSASFLFTNAVVAQTTFDDGDATDSYIENPLNWDNGAPSAVNPGTISIDANVGLGTMTDWVVTQTGGNITQGSFPNLSLTMSGGSWTMNGGSFSQRSQSFSNGAVFTINSGSVETKNNSAIVVDGSGSQYIINAGTVTADRGIRTVGGGNFTMNGGTLNSDVNDAFGGNGFSGNLNMNFNGGTLTGGRLTFQGGTDKATFGGSTAGSASFLDWGVDDNSDRQDDDNIFIDFTAGAAVSLNMGSATRALILNTVTQTSAWAEALWNAGQLIYTDGATIVSGADPDASGWTIVSWADASDSATGFGTASSEYFDWADVGSFGGDLVLGTVVVPEPSTFALLAGMFGFTWVMLRRRA